MIINNFFIETNIRKKFFIFLCLFFIFIGIGIFYKLDGIVMLFMVSELSVLLIFITMFSQLYSYVTKSQKINSYIIFFLILILNISYFELNVLNYNHYYSFFNIQLNDFYYIFNYYFEKQIFVTILLITIITLYSIFFIFLYFIIKKQQNLENTKKNTFSLLRKQNIIHQSNYSTQIRIFQK